MLYICYFSFLICCLSANTYFECYYYFRESTRHFKTDIYRFLLICWVEKDLVTLLLGFLAARLANYFYDFNNCVFVFVLFSVISLILVRSIRF